MIKQLGYVTTKQGIHVCGYKGNKIIVQTEIGEDTPLKTLKLYTNNKGQYFNLEGSRIYLRHTLEEYKQKKVDDKFNSKEEEKRIDVIKRYENIVKKWDGDPDQTLKRILPDKYIEIKDKLKLLKEGFDFTITDETQELKTAIAYVGGQIPRVNYGSKGLINKDNGISWEEARKVASQF